MIYIQSAVWLVIIMLPLTVYFVVARRMSWLKAIGISIALLLGALAVSISDVKADDCSQLFEVVAVEVDPNDPDENTLYKIRVSKWTQDNGSDGVCQWFGECVLDLISHSPGMMAAVEIINPEDEWVPSARRWIEVHWAMALAGVVDLEEQAWISQYGHYSERGSD